jgi:hypothetical protein
MKRRVIDAILESAMDEMKDNFWREKSIEELAREQQVKPIKDITDVLGKGKDLWASDEEFEEFLAGIRDRRRGDTGASAA